MYSRYVNNSMKTLKINVRIKYQLSIKSRLIISLKEPEFLFLKRYECVEVGGFSVVDVLAIKLTGDKFCRNLVIFHDIIFNLTYIVPYLLLAI